LQRTVCFVLLAFGILVTCPRNLRAFGAFIDFLVLAKYLLLALGYEASIYLLGENT